MYYNTYKFEVSNDENDGDDGDAKDTLVKRLITSLLHIYII
jgi:hypothetical protein